jgi:fructose-specific phosphotransferase system IIA component
MLTRRRSGRDSDQRIGGQVIMLMVVMHNNEHYLEALLSFLWKEGVVDATIVEKGDIGLSMIGGGGSYVFHKGVISSEYDRALVAVVRGEEKTRLLLHSIEKDPELDSLSWGDSGFICVVPFQQIKRLELESSGIGGEKPKMKILDYLREERMLLELKARTKDEAIRELATLLRDAEEIADFGAFLTDVFEREKLATTGIGNEAAIPHARSDAVNRFVIAFGRSREGVEFDSLDGKPVKLIFLMGTPKEKQLGDYLKVLAHLSRILRARSFRDSLLEASDPEGIKERSAIDSGSRELSGIFLEASYWVFLFSTSSVWSCWRRSVYSMISL